MTTKKKTDDTETGPAGYHGQTAADAGYDSRAEDVGTFADHVALDQGVTVHKGGVEAVGVPDDK